METQIFVAHHRHIKYAGEICNMIEEAAKIRKTGIAKRAPDYIKQKIKEGKSIIAINEEKVIGFCYIESWEGKKYVANSGLIVHPDYRNTGLAKKIKHNALYLSKKLYPNAILFGITTSLAVMKINSDLGYKPVTFSELTKDETFWAGCKSCSNYDILQRTGQAMCLCTGMMCDLSKLGNVKTTESKTKARENMKRFFRLQSIRIERKLKQISKHKDLVKNEE